VWQKSKGERMKYREEIKKILDSANIEQDVIDDVDDILADIETKVNEAKDLIDELSDNLY